MSGNGGLRRGAAALSPVLAALGLASLGCELVAGIKDKTLVQDGGPSDAGAADGYGAADAGHTDPSVPCAQQPAYLFCEDFDGVTSVGELMTKDGWTYGPNTRLGGALQLDPSVSRSPPQSAQVTVPSVQNAAAQLGEILPGALGSSVRLAVDLLLDVPSLDAIPQVGISQMILKGGAPVYSYQLGPGAGCSLAASADGGLPAVVPLATCPSVRTWTRIVIAYDASSGASVYEDGQLVGSAAPGMGPPGMVELIVGAVYVNAPSGPGSTLTFEIDDVVVRGQ